MKQSIFFLVVPLLFGRPVHGMEPEPIDRKKLIAEIRLMKDPSSFCANVANNRANEATKLEQMKRLAKKEERATWCCCGYAASTAISLVAVEQSMLHPYICGISGTYCCVLSLAASLYFCVKTCEKKDDLQKIQQLMDSPLHHD